MKARASAVISLKPAPRVSMRKVAVAIDGAAAVTMDERRPVISMHSAR
jgi:hypothetical protein